MSERFIVAEMSKNWIGDEPYEPGTLLISHMLEHVINENHRRGYRLYSFVMNRVVSGDVLNETIVAVFEKQNP
jgi:hypothetical protein